MLDYTKCPFCEGKIPKEKIKEFQSRFKAKESDIKRQIEEDYNKKLKITEDKLNQQKDFFEEFKKTFNEQKDKDLKKLEKEINKRFEKDLEEKNKELSTIKNKLKYREDEIREELEKDYKKDLDKKNEEIRDIKKKNLEEAEKLKTDYEDKIRKIENKSPSELGDEGQTKVKDILSENFKYDDITETKHGKTGSDIFHRVFYNEKEIGLIIYEVKNVSNWSNDYIKQVQEDKIKHNANYAFLVSNVLPAKEKILAQREGILIVSPDKVPIIVREIRNFLIDVHKNKLSQEEVEEKIRELQEYLTSQEYKNIQSDLMNSIKEWYGLRSKEVISHQNHWTEEERLNRKIAEKTAKINSKITSVLEKRADRTMIISQEQIKKKKINSNV